MSRVSFGAALIGGAGQEHHGQQNRMAEDAEYLFTIAEVAAAFAGFAGLVTVVAQRGSPRDLTVALNLLRNMLLVALLVVLASLAPHVVLRLGISPGTAWRVAGGAFFLGWLAYIVVAAPAAYRHVRDVDRREGLFWYPHLALHLVAGGCLLATAIEISSGKGPGLYSLALYILLYMAAYLLLRLFLMLVRP
jgi:hypothetical protein